jgi:hypothetical protein
MLGVFGIRLDRFGLLTFPWRAATPPILNCVHLNSQLVEANMMRRNHLVLCLCYFLAVLALGAIPLDGVERGPVRPNVLFLMPDQMRGDCLSILGHSGVRTPQLDELAKQGAGFRRAYSPVPSCIPAGRNPILPRC